VEEGRGKVAEYIEGKKTHGEVTFYWLLGNMKGMRKTVSREGK